MKIIVVSDSHGNYSKLEKILEVENDSDYFFHLGDYTIPSYFLNRFHLIRGNCDYDYDIPDFIDLEIDNIKFHFEHGNNLNKEKIISKNIDVCLSGHTHEKYHKKIKGTLFLNPGSLSKPRDSNTGSYLIIKIDNHKVTYKFKEIDLLTDEILN